MNVISKLAFRRITAKKARSVVICAAVLLTTVLFMTVVSIAVNMLSAYSLMLRMAAGTDGIPICRKVRFQVMMPYGTQE